MSFLDLNKDGVISKEEFIDKYYCNVESVKAKQEAVHLAIIEVSKKAQQDFQSIEPQKGETELRFWDFIFHSSPCKQTSVLHRCHSFHY